MKKQYINPTMDVVTMKMEGYLLDGSLNSTGGSVEKNDLNGDGGGALGRGGDFDDWDD